MNPMIRIRNLSTYYGERKILSEINLEILEGERMVILGASGCGKTTLLRHIIGLLRPAEGQIVVDGTDIAKLPEEEIDKVRLKMGVLFQSGALFNSISVGENVALPLKEHTALNEKVIQIMTKMKLESVGLAGFEELMPGELSGGMRKRAGLARAMAMDPKILFFDEPSSGLDPIVADGIDNLILKISRAFKTTMVVVTHDLKSAFKIADRITLLFKGEILVTGRPEELRDSKDSRIQNFLAGHATEEEIDTKAYLERLMS
ncbi:MAG: ABC transporter ATP-binding protein [Candidatus Wallbacteria bacterium]|nr:ABC transporter ATP-binding protein [Candidatus Wallbacteria bacterium]